MSNLTEQIEWVIDSIVLGEDQTMWIKHKFLPSGAKVTRVGRPMRIGYVQNRIRPGYYMIRWNDTGDYEQLSFDQLEIVG